MPYVRVHIDSDEILEELSDNELREELASRHRNKTGGSKADFQIPAGDAADAMDKAATALRAAGRPDLAFKLDEARHDYIEPHVQRVNNYRFKTEPQKLNA